MDRKEIILVAFAPAKGESHTPVQVQKLLFLIEKQIPECIGGTHYNFVPYNYGPFDASIYRELGQLMTDGFVEAIPDGNWVSYRLTKAGQDKGDILLNGLSGKAREFIKSVSSFVRSLSFTQLVSAIYKAYPEMKANSVFQSCK